MGRLRSWHAKNERRQARESRASTRQVRRQLAVPRPTREPPLEHVAHVARRVRVAIDDAIEPRPGVIHEAAHLVVLTRGSSRRLIRGSLEALDSGMTRP